MGRDRREDCKSDTELLFLPQASSCLVHCYKYQVCIQNNRLSLLLSSRHKLLPNQSSLEDLCDREVINKGKRYIGKTAPRGAAASGPRKPCPHLEDFTQSSSRIHLAEIWYPPAYEKGRQIFGSFFLGRSYCALRFSWGSSFLWSIHSLERKVFGNSKFENQFNPICINQVVYSRYFVHSIYLSLRLKSYQIHISGKKNK